MRLYGYLATKLLNSGYGTILIEAVKKAGHEVKKRTHKAAAKTEEGAQKVKDKTDRN